MNWSDHPPKNPGPNTTVYGPSWVGDIINAVGHDACNGKYWNTDTQHGGEPTAVIVTWDDWGGWYDHIPPWAYYRGTSNSCPSTPPYNAPNGWGCGYVSGFRVPLLVVSPYTGQNHNGTITNYVSGACGTGTPNASCPNFGTPTNPTQYVHDFGSILAFTEYNFGLLPIDLLDKGYADYNAPDWGPNGYPNGNVPLSDFFGLYPNPRTTFVHINTDKDYKWFENASQNLPAGTYPGDPDDDTDSD